MYTFVSDHRKMHMFECCDFHLNTPLTFCHLETSFDAFANKADPDQGLLCLLTELLLDMILHYIAS